MNNKDLAKIADMEVNKVLEKYCIPPLGIEDNIPLFANVGFTFTGIGDGFEFVKEKFDSVSELDKWKMIALSNIYWLNFYESGYNARGKALNLLADKTNYYEFVNENTETIDVYMAMLKARKVSDGETEN